MDIRISAIHCEVKEETKNVLQSKIQKLDKYFNHIGSCETFLKKEKSNNHSDFVVELKVEVPRKKHLFAVGKSDSFEKSIDKAISSLKPQLRKVKEKMQSHRR